MPKLDMTVLHSLSQEEARQRVKNLLGDIKLQFADKMSNLKEEWENEDNGNFSFSVAGFRVSGTLAIGDTAVKINANLPLAATFFKNRIESIIKERARLILA